MTGRPTKHRSGYAAPDRIYSSLQCLLSGFFQPKGTNPERYAHEYGKDGEGQNPHERAVHGTGTAV